MLAHTWCRFRLLGGKLELVQFEPQRPSPIVFDLPVLADMHLHLLAVVHLPPIKLTIIMVARGVFYRLRY
jgi:hypothetical protein